MTRVLLRAPLLTQSGYGHHGRTVLRALRSREDLFDIYIHPLSWGGTGWLWESDNERRWIDETIKKTVQHTANKGTFDLSIQVTIPNEWEKIAPVNIGVTAGIETTKVAAEWIEKSFLMDKILTISQFAKDSYVNTVYEAVNNQTGEQIDYRVQTPIEVIHYPVRKFEPDDLNLQLKTDFNFLAVAQIGPRKNIEQLIRVFVDKFRDNSNVGLIIKGNSVKNSKIDRITTSKNLTNLLNTLGERKCKLYLLHGFLTDQQMASLYLNPKVKALVSTTHGEGFGLPLFEAAYYGLPIVATDWSGHLDFLYMKQKQKNGKEKLKHMFNKISYTLQPVPQHAVWENVIVKDSAWAYPEAGSIKMNLEDVYKDHGRFKKRSTELKKWICENFKEDSINEQYVQQITSVLPDVENLNSWLDELEVATIE
tara:strand:- start:4202 stop:5470 length:1269 start_codon:yes stop_codon:yes gene_type:complete